MILNDEYLESILRDAFTNLFEDQRNNMDFYPSSCSAKDSDGEEIGGCTRASYYDKTATVALAPDIKGSMIMANGSVMGDFISRCFQKAGVAVAPNGLDGEMRVRIDRVTEAGVEYGISGRVDQLCLDARGQVIGYEFKTIYSKGKAGRIIQHWRGTEEPDPKNVMQTAVYAWWGREHGIMDWRLTYFYIHSGKQPLSKTYYINVSSDGSIYVDGNRQKYNINSIFEKFDLLADSVAAQEAPPREYELLMDDETLDRLAINGQLTRNEQTLVDKKMAVPARWSPCGFCRYRQACWSEEELMKYEEARDS